MGGAGRPIAGSLIHTFFRGGCLSPFVSYRATLPILAFLLLALPVSGQTARTAQFVFIVDDSKSMDETDPNRLSVFAVRSLINMLDDRDEVSVVRLNGPNQGETPPPIEPLKRNRQRVLGLLGLDRNLARYGADNTRCRSALEDTKRLLNEAYREDVAQVVMFLSDGECTPRGEETLDVDDFLRGLKSHEDGLFQFYMLLFRGKTFTPAMKTLATRTGGDSFEVGSSDPTAILHPFAQALSRSQGYRAYLLSAKERRLDAHRGAERVRLLAVAGGDRPPLTISLNGRRAPAARTGVHRYGQGEPFRFAALDYRPGAEPVTVTVDGAGDDWTVVAVPEYRLSVRMQFVQGTCERPGPPTLAVDTGSSVCALIELINSKGQVVEGGDVEAKVRVQLHGQPLKELTANPLSGGARFGLQRSNLEKGDYEIQSAVTLNLPPGDAIHLKSRALTLEVSSQTIEPRPERFDFGTLSPGVGAQQKLTLTGAFLPTPARLEWRDRGQLPACVSAEFGGIPEGKKQILQVDQSYNLTLRVAPYCGPDSFQRPFDTVLRLVLDNGRIVELPVNFAVDYQIQIPAELSVRVKAGETAEVPLPIKGNFHGEIPWRKSVILPEETEDLSVSFQDKPLRLRVAPDRCCAGGTYQAEARLAAPSMEPVLVPVRIEVEPAGFWACYGPRILVALAALLLLLLLLYIVNMVRNSSFLKAETLASKLKPLVWTAFGDTMEQKGSHDDVLRRVRKALPFQNRALTWLRANPLKFGLPGGSYRETVELIVSAAKDMGKLYVDLRVEPDLQGRMARQPETYSGRLFATALGGVVFLAMPDANGRICKLAQQDGFTPEDGKPRAIKLKKARLLKNLESWETYEENTAAGWQVG